MTVIYNLISSPFIINRIRSNIDLALYYKKKKQLNSILNI